MQNTNADLIVDGGNDAWYELNNELQRNIAKAYAWYGNNTSDFITSIGKSHWHRASSRITSAFRILPQDWLLVITECNQLCNSWYTDHIANKGKCSWLHMYRSLKGRVGKQTLLEDLGPKSTSLGIVAGRPAARVDSWGLIVLAYSNGAKIEMIHSDAAAGFSATLDARNFVLSIGERALTLPIIASIEPKEHPDTGKTSLFDDEVNNLLLHGHSFRPMDINIGWPLFGGDDSEPPAELVDGRFDNQLRRCVLSDLNVGRLKERLWRLIHNYKRQWYNLGKQPNLVASLADLQKDIVKSLENWMKEVLDEVDKVNNLPQPHLILEDMLITDRESLEEISDQGDQRWPDGNQEKQKFLKMHRQVVACESMFILSQHIPRELSTRDMGKAALLA